MNKFEQQVHDKSEGATKVLGTYVTAKTRITLGCNHGHTWTVIPSNLVSRGDGIFCRECAGQYRTGIKTTEIFIEELSVIHPGIKVLGEYKGAHTPIEIMCKEGHVRQVKPTNLLSRETYSLCPECGEVDRGKYNRLTLEQANQRVQDKYPFLEVTSYTSSTESLEALDTRCGHTGEYWLSNLAQGKGYACKVCSPSKSSAQEDQLYEYIKSIYNGWIIRHDRSILGGTELDIVLPDIGLAFEFNGAYWHSDREKPSNYHQTKTNMTEEFGYQLIHIYDYDIKNSFDIVKSRISALLGQSYIIYASKCVVKEISYPQQFLIANHIQGKGRPSSVNLGLFYKEELVAVMTFAKSTRHKKYQYELMRYCSLLDTTVVGGASKLLKYFERNYKPESIYTYAARDWSTGNLYKQLNFDLVGTTDPGYIYEKNGKVFSRQKFQTHKLAGLFPNDFDPENDTEFSLLDRLGYNRVYNSGNLLFAKVYKY